MTFCELRVGVPSIYWSPIEETKKTVLSPTTSGVTFKEIWKKTDVPEVILKFKLLGSMKNARLPQQGDIIAVDIVMPCWMDGSNEIRRISKATVISRKYRISPIQAEVIEYKIAFLKANWTSYDHYCEQEKHEECHGNILVDPDNSVKYSISY